ncbi:MAG: flagellar basal body-associated FliL family protein [Calditrichaeota bacterium]|nr:flagellar basal body-associated FliL family protein [Calditrichota bacterium]
MNKPNVERIAVPESQAVDNPPKKKSPLVMIIIIIAAVGLGAVGVWKFLPTGHKSGFSSDADSIRPPRETPTFGEVFLIEDLIINPAGTRRVFMCSVGLEVADAEKVKEVKRRESLLRDNLLTLFSSQSMEVLLDIKYRQAFRARVKKIMDYQLGEGIVKRVFFEKWVLQ